MEHQTDINMYKGLASYFLPDGVLDYFDVVDFTEEPTPKDRLYRNILHLYLRRARQSPVIDVPSQAQRLYRGMPHTWLSHTWPQDNTACPPPKMDNSWRAQLYRSTWKHSPRKDAILEGACAFLKAADGQWADNREVLVPHIHDRRRHLWEELQGRAQWLPVMVAAWPCLRLGAASREQGGAI